MKIPKIFHRVWFGNEMPQEYQDYGQTWFDKHPGWEGKLWSEGDIPELDSHPNFLAAETYSEKSDFYRHWILANEGGVYIDTDFECFHNIEELIEDCESFAASENHAVISCGILGCVPGTAFFERILWCLLNEWVGDGNAAVNSGPAFVTRKAKEHELSLDKVFGPETFYPYSFAQEYTGNPRDYPSAYAAHHWAATWFPENRDDG